MYSTKRIKKLIGDIGELKEKEIVIQDKIKIIEDKQKEIKENYGKTKT